MKISSTLEIRLSCLQLGRLRDGGMVLTAQELGEDVQSVELVLDADEVEQVAEYMISAGERARRIRGQAGAGDGSMLCPVCGGEPAPNATPADRRCGPCHNFELVAMTAFGVLHVSIPFEIWADRLVDELTKKQNMDAYRDWLHRLRLAHHSKTTGRG